MISIQQFAKYKRDKKPIVMLTAYDYFGAKVAEAAGVDILLIGDSLGMVVLGYQNTLQVTVEDVIYHTKAVRRGAPNTFLIADMPYQSYHLSLQETKANAMRMMVESGANAVKLEGGTPSRLEAIQAIVDCEVPVCAHLGLTPQSIHRFGGYKVQGKDQEDYYRLLEQATQIEAAGAFMLVLEGIPEGLGKEISHHLQIPTIGIGAGRFVDGQVMVYHDILHLSDIQAKFVKVYADLQADTTKAINEYAQDVRTGVFPAVDQCYYPLQDSDDGIII